MDCIEEISPDGPLTTYRKRATFDWRQLKLFLEGEQSIRFKKRIYDTLRSDPLFQREWKSLSLEEGREITHRRWKRIVEYNFLGDDTNSMMERTGDLISVLEAYDQALAARYFLSAGVFFSAVLLMGTERHSHILQQCFNNQIVGCFCLTELSHGSDTNAIRTECRFENGRLVLHTPDDEALKCWAGNLSHSATHAVVFAQLYTEGVCRGVHALCVQVRDRETMRSLPGITIGDMGEKPGEWNAVENGWMRFTNHSVPLDALLNRSANVTSDGKYLSAFKSKREQQWSTLGALSVGRVAIIAKGALATSLAAVISIRYSAVRTQFGPPGKSEQCLLEYPMQQRRVLPILAAALALTLFHRKFNDFFRRYMQSVVYGDKHQQTVAMGREVHALSSAAKPIATWTCVAALSEARLACGGHGYLKCSRLNDLRESFDPSQTFEGENNVLLQQASSAILSLGDTDASIESPMRTFDVFQKPPPPNTETIQNDPIDDVIIAYEWLLHYLRAESEAKIREEQSKGKDLFAARNAAQYGYCRSLAIAYGEHCIVSWFRESIDEAPKELRPVLLRFCTLYALTTIEKHIATLYIGGYCRAANVGKRMREAMVDAESAVKGDAIAVCDALALPDFVLHSALGVQDGRVYERLAEEFHARTSIRPKWWSDLSEFLSRSKL